MFRARLTRPCKFVDLRVSVNRYQDAKSMNWYYAVNGYHAWIKGIVKIEQGKNGERKYRLDYEYKMADRYNWDTGKTIELTAFKKRIRIMGQRLYIDDKTMGEFHRQGLAKEFDVYGSFKGSIEW